MCPSASPNIYIGQLRRDLRAIEKKGRDTALFVTTDHGRAYHFTDHGRTYPESARMAYLTPNEFPSTLNPKSATA